MIKHLSRRMRIFLFSFHDFVKFLYDYMRRRMNMSIYIKEKKKVPFTLFLLFTIFYYLLSLCTLAFVCAIIYIVPFYFLSCLYAMYLYIKTRRRRRREKKRRMDTITIYALCSLLLL
jgi:4-hydroxybenzoate polyprenyltransferase